MDTISIQDMILICAGVFMLVHGFQTGFKP